MIEKRQAPKSLRYIGPPKTRQFPPSHWLEPGEIIVNHPGYQALADLPDFEVVDTTLDALPEPEADLEEEDEGE